MKLWITVCIALAATTGSVASQELTLKMPASMLAEGFDKQILPRFKFKHRIAIAPVTDGDADMVLGTEPIGTRVFQGNDDTEFRLSIETDNADAKAQAATFLGWLQSVPGKAAIESFAPDGTPRYTTELKAVAVAVPETFDGDTEIGARLALVHCGRCHVIDKRNRMGGIGSTPSFAAMRGRSNWPDLFRAFYVENPHPSFTQVEGVTEPFDPNRQIHVAPVEITLEEIEAITAFVATLKPKDLGRRVLPN